MSCVLFPSMSTSPAVGFISPKTVFKVVVLPQPFAPMMQTNSPCSTVNDTPWTISVLWYPPWTSRTSRRWLIAYHPFWLRLKMKMKNGTPMMDVRMPIGISTVAIRRARLSTSKR